MHRATVNRHIDTLEGAFRTNLFQRHARGYTLTESGQDMLEVAGRADEMFADLAGRNQGRSSEFSGKLVVTALPGVAPLIMPALREFHLAHPQIALEFVATTDLARLEYGEAHVAFRAGPKPETPDYVVRLFRRVCFGIYASRDCVERCGQPDINDLSGHTFVGSKDRSSRFPYAHRMKANLCKETTLIQIEEPHVLKVAIATGLGIGFLADHDAAQTPDLVEIVAPSKEWSAPIWTVTHVDLHRTGKVQSFLNRI